jgi:molecular chaperone HtpG
VQYGTLSDEKFAEKAKGFSLLKSIDGNYYTLEEYKEKVKALQTNKDDKTVCLYSNDEEGHYSFIKKAKERGYDVLILDGPLVPHWIGKLELSEANLAFSRIDADTLDNLIQKSEEIPSKLSKDDEEKLKPAFENVVSKEKFNVKFESMSEDEAPIIITQPEFIRRMMEQQKLGGGGFYGAFPETYNLIVNANHEKVVGLLTKEEEEKNKSIKQLTDLALLAQGMLKGEALSNFIERTIEQVV